MGTVYDLPRIQKALSALDKLAADNPERCQGVGQWDEKSVGAIMGQSTSERSRAYRERKRESGHKQVNVVLTPEAVKRLEEIQAEYPELTISDVVSAALVGTRHDS